MADNNDTVVIDKDKLSSIREAALKTVPEKTPATTTVSETPKDTPKEVATPEAQVEIQVEQPKPSITAESLSDDELIALLEKRGKRIATDTLTDEQKKKQSDLEKLDKRKFAIEQMGMTDEQLSEIEGIVNADGLELTKKEFTKSYKTENPKATKEEIADAYDDYYNIQKTIKVKEKQIKKGEDDIDEEVEVEVEKPKFDEKFVKWGENRRNAKAERIKASAKSVLDNIDTAYNNQRAWVAKANEYVATAKEVVDKIDFSALPVQYKFTDDKGKVKEINAIVKLNDEAKTDVINYLNGNLAQLIIGADKQKDGEEISRQIKKYIKEQYDNQVGESLYRLGQTEGINIGKVGASSPVERTLVSDDSRVNEVAAEVEARIPISKDNPVLKNR